LDISGTKISITVVKRGESKVDILSLVLIAIMSLLLIYQTKLFRDVSKERDSLKKRVEDIEGDIDSELKSKREQISKLNREIEELHNRAAYIKVDQLELNKEYEYLQSRNRKLEEAVHSLEDRVSD
jgi:peptidoglycan hydrolase CwlO-like protein